MKALTSTITKAIAMYQVIYVEENSALIVDYCLIWMRVDENKNNNNNNNNSKNNI